MTALATTLQAFFTDRLVRQRQVSPNTLCAYRDTLRLLLVFASDRKGNAPSKLDIDDLDASLVGAFLNDLEQQRKNSVRTRNARLAAIRSLFRYAALRHPEHASAIERVLAIPPKRFERRLMTFLTEAEINALLAAPDRSTGCELQREGTKATDHAAHLGHSRRLAFLAGRAGRSTRSPAVHHTDWQEDSAGTLSSTGLPNTSGKPPTFVRRWHKNR